MNIQAVLTVFLASLTLQSQGFSQADNPTNDRNTKIAERNWDTRVPSFITREQLFDTLSTAHASDVVAKFTLTRLYGEYISQFEALIEEKKPQTIASIGKSYQAHNFIDTPTQNEISTLWDRANQIEKELFATLEARAPAETKTKLKLAWASANANYWGRIFKASKSSVKWAGDIGQVDLMQCLSTCLPNELQNPNAIQSATEYEQKRGALLKELATLSLNTNKRLRESTVEAQRWVSEQMASQPNENWTPQASMGIAMAMQMAPMLCKLQQIIQLQDETATALTKELSPTESWCFHASMIERSIMDSIASNYDTKIMQSWSESSGDDPADLARRKQIEAFQAEDTQRIQAWLNIMKEHMTQQCALVDSMLDLDNLDLTTTVQKLQTEGGVLTPKVNAQDLRTARFVLLKRFVTSLDEAQASNPAVLLEAPAP